MNPFVAMNMKLTKIAPSVGTLIFVCRTAGRLCLGSSSETYLVAVYTEAQMVNLNVFQKVSSLSRKQG